VKPPPHRIGFTVKLKRCVIGDHSVVRNVRGRQKWVHCRLGRFGSAGHGEIKSSTYPEQFAGREMPGEQIVTRASASAFVFACGQKLGMAEYRMGFEEIDGFHDLLFRTVITTNNSDVCVKKQVIFTDIFIFEYFKRIQRLLKQRESNGFTQKDFPAVFFDQA
jgi:hypothetical protein